MNINELPPELLARIFSNIDDFSQKIALERICKHWHQIVPLDWKMTKICRKPLIDRQTLLGLVLNRCGQWLEELWLQNMQINEQMVNQMARRMNCLKHLKLSFCQLDSPAVNSIVDLFGQQLFSFILDRMDYHPNMRRLIENESSKLEHLSLFLLEDNYSAGTLPTKLPNNLKSFSLHTGWNRGIYEDFLALISNIARDCENLKILHLQIHKILPNMISAIGQIKSLVYLNLDVNEIEDAFLENKTTFKNVICRGLPNLKALRIAGHCSEETLSNICRGRPDLVHLNVFTRNAFQISDSLNSLTLRIPSTVDASQFLPELLFEQPNTKSIQHLDIRSIILPSSSNFMEKLLGQFPNLKSLHCQMPASNAYLTSFLPLIKKHLKNGRKNAIYFHQDAYDPRYYKYILPDDLPQFDTDVDWRPKVGKGKCENLVLKKLIKEAIDGGNNPSFLDEW